MKILELNIGYQYFAGGYIDDYTERWLLHKVDMTVGQSGSPIYEFDGSGYYAIAINSAEYRYKDKNVGVLATLEMVNAGKEIIEKYAP